MRHVKLEKMTFSGLVTYKKVVDNGLIYVNTSFPPNLVKKNRENGAKILKTPQNDHF